MAVSYWAGNIIRCLSTDAKPSATAFANHALYESDTGNQFYSYGGVWVDISYHSGVTNYHAAETGQSSTHTHAAGAHPDLAAHDTLGLATQAELDAHQAFPVSSVFFSVVSTNPNTLLGYGTWAQIAQGKFIVGQNGADVDFDIAEETGGAKTHTHADHTGVIAHTHPVTDPGHTHVITELRDSITGSASTNIAVTADTTSTLGTKVTGSRTTGLTTNSPSGGVAALGHSSPSHLPPYLVLYCWKRTA